MTLGKNIKFLKVQIAIQYVARSSGGMQWGWDIGDCNDNNYALESMQ